MVVRIGTRNSTLALWQAEKVKEKLQAAGIDAGLVHVSTTGDQVQGKPLHQIGTPGLFTRALDEALLAGKIDLAVHSAKDIPSAFPSALSILAFLKREDPRDVLLASSEEGQLENFSASITVGTSSLRRRAFIAHYFPHARVKDIRGNVDTRLKKMLDGEYDAIMLAYAAVKRMALEGYMVQKFHPQRIVPAVGQGAIAVMGRREDQVRLGKVRETLNHLLTEQAVTCERAFLKAIQGGCQVPVFGLATVFQDQISLTAGMAANDGKELFQMSREGRIEAGESMGIQLAQEIKEKMNISAGI